MEEMLNDKVTLFILFQYANLLVDWACKYIGIWCCIVGWVVLTVSKDCSASIFRVKQPKKKILPLIHRMSWHPNAINDLSRHSSVNEYSRVGW